MRRAIVQDLSCRGFRAFGSTLLKTVINTAATYVPFFTDLTSALVTLYDDPVYRRSSLIAVQHNSVDYRYCPMKIWDTFMPDDVQFNLLEPANPEV